MVKLQDKKNVVHISLIRPTVRDMETGRIAYIVPWALYLDQNNDVWIIGNAGFYPGSSGSGTATIKIIRTSGGFFVDLSTVEAEGGCKQKERVDEINDFKVKGWMK